MLKCSTLIKIKYFCEKIRNFFKINRHNFHHEGRGVEDTGDHFHLTSIIDPTIKLYHVTNNTKTCNTTIISSKLLPHVFSILI